MQKFLLFILEEILCLLSIIALILVFPLFIIRGLIKNNLKDTLDDWIEVARYLYDWITSI